MMKKNASITRHQFHIHHAMHAFIDRQKNHGMHVDVRAKALRMSGGSISWFHFFIGFI